MSKSPRKNEPSLLQKHLDRARDLGVELEEYAEAYNVNLEALIVPQTHSVLVCLAG